MNHPLSSSSSSSSPTSLVHKRMQDVLIAHESTLSNLNLASLEHRNFLQKQQQKENKNSSNQRSNNTSTNNRNKNKATNQRNDSTTTTQEDEQEQKQQEESKSLSLAQAALYRTFHHQPLPFQRINHNYDPNNLIIDLNLNPPERVSPQDLLIHDKRRPSTFVLSQHYNNHHGNGLILGGGGGGSVGGLGSLVEDHNVDIASLTLKTITVLSTLCDEAHELYDIGKYKLIPKLHLFAHDLKHGEFQNDQMMNSTSDTATTAGSMSNATTAAATTTTSNTMHHSSSNTSVVGGGPVHNNISSPSPISPPSMNVILDEKILADRDSKLLHRMSKFITSLQSTQNYVQRCHRLIRNIICQIHGCLSPIVLSYNEEDDDDDDMNGLFGANSTEYDSDDDGTKNSNKSNLSVPRFIGNRIKRNSNNNTTTSTSNNKTNNHPKSKNSNNPQQQQQQQKVPPPTLPPLFRQSNYLIMLGEAMIKLLTILISLDTIIGQNFELHEAWDLYKSIVTERAEKLEESLAAKVAANDFSLDGIDNYDDDEDDMNNEVNKKDDGYEDDDEFDNDEYRNKLISLERMIMQIDFTLLSSRSFLICIEQNFDPRGRFCFNPVTEHDKSRRKRGMTNATSSNSSDDKKKLLQPKPLHEHVKNLVSSLYEWYCSVIHTNEESTERFDMVGIYGLYCLYRRLLPSNKEPDEKLHRALCTVFPMSFPIIPLYGNIPFMPVDFISKYAPLDVSRLGGRGRTRVPKQSEIMNGGRDVLEKLDKTFDRKVTLLYDEAMAWLLRAESELAPLERSNDAMLFEDLTNNQTDMILTPSDHQNSYEMNQVKQKSEIVLRGMMIGRQATIMLQTFLFLHTFLHVDIETKHVTCVKQLCYIAKSIEQVLGVRRRSCVVSMNKAVLKMLASSLYSCFDRLRSYIDQRSVDHGREASDQIHISSISTSLWALESILKGTSTFSPSRRYAMEVSVYVCSQESFNCISNEEKKSIRNLMNQIKWIADVDEKLNQVCDCSFLYFHRGAYPLIFKNLFAESEYREVEEIQLMMSAFSDSTKTLRSSSYFDPTFYPRRYCEFVIDRVFNQEFLQPLCFKIEASLRLLLFSKNLNEMRPFNPKEQRFGRFKKYIEMPPLQFCGKKISIKKTVERYLEKSFYNFSTVGLRDSKTYSEMALLGSEIYGLTLIDNKLPKENIQGVDFPEILNVSNFARKYNYNMVQQNFIERKMNNGCKYLKTLGIETISYSFQRHGLGMSKTIIAEVSTNLQKSFESLKEIFADNLLRSFLSKESRWCNQMSTNQSSNYSLERAMAFRKELAEVGNNDEDSASLSMLEQCRECVTLIGNMLGLVRLVQSGKMYSVNQSTKSLSFDTSRRSVNKTKDDSILDLITNKFLDLQSNSGNLHDLSILLQNFYILFPALSLAWLDTSIRGKDMLSKKYQTFDAYYTDDGFAMGSAFILEVLDQSTSMDKLNWFESSCVAFASNRKEILENLKRHSQNNSEATKKEKSKLFGSRANEESKQDDSNDDELSRLRVVAKRLEVRKQEMELLHYTVLGARVFFTLT